ncbi:SatD family protein [Marinilongibacter aquaticus]|uniref:SatD family protein n=1 Tax=Marinilongibacter aquaticus TaxID=2975157 RepID=UPI0021BD347A|nr:SatD family protein [Marinilongibacter aquaticus]UBM59155.1 SatD family protein [Marinilongibacter aquaticus]
MQVITADIVHSTGLAEEQRTALRQLLAQEAKGSEGRYEYFIRGDSFQILLEKNALRETLMLKNLFFFKLEIRCRASLGIGSIGQIAENLSNSNGEAFVLSGKGLDQMKNKAQLLSLHSADEKINAEWNVHCRTLDYIERGQTKNQAEAMYWLLKGKNQTEIARLIGIEQSSVNRRIQSSGWSLTESILARYNETINTL